MVLNAGDRSRGTVLSTEPGTAALQVEGSRGMLGEQGTRGEGCGGKTRDRSGRPVLTNAPGTAAL